MRQTDRQKEKIETDKSKIIKNTQSTLKLGKM